MKSDSTSSENSYDSNQRGRTGEPRWSEAAKSEINLNRQLPPLPRLDQWKDTKEQRLPHSEFPQTTATHIASLLRQQQSPTKQRVCDENKLQRHGQFLTPTRPVPHRVDSADESQSIDSREGTKLGNSILTTGDTSFRACGSQRFSSQGLSGVFSSTEHNRTTEDLVRIKRHSNHFSNGSVKPQMRDNEQFYLSAHLNDVAPLTPPKFTKPVTRDSQRDSEDDGPLQNYPNRFEISCISVSPSPKDANQQPKGFFSKLLSNSEEGQEKGVALDGSRRTSWC